MELWIRQFTFTKNVAKLINEIVDKNHGVTMGEVYRTKEQAQWYVNKNMGILNSLHCKKLAVDLNIFSLEGELLLDHQTYEQFGIFWEKLDPSNRWGGHFMVNGVAKPDIDHFEMREN